jgi:hypothetical protein
MESNNGPVSNIQSHDQLRTVTLRRDGKGALKFKGQRIGSAGRVHSELVDYDESRVLEIDARLFKTSGGKYVVEVEEFDKTHGRYGIRFAEAAATLEELVGLLKSSKGPNIDYDILGGLFEGTEVADQFVEQVD